VKCEIQAGNIGLDLAFEARTTSQSLSGKEILMKRDLEILNRAAVILAIVTLFGVGAGCTRKTTSDQAARAAADSVATAPSLGDRVRETTPDSSAAPYDLQFLDTMRAHHQMALDMARLAVEKASHAELKSLAEAMIAEQQEEMTRMLGWRDSWYAGRANARNDDLPGMKESMAGMSLEHLHMLTGQDFDRMFLDMMIPHHRGAVDMASDALSRLEHESLRDLSREIIEGQQKEIETMTRWKGEWSATG
jgi:uncharacterized protein (DUF305 family)